MRLTLHLTREQRILLEQAAALRGVALNDFLLDHACAAAALLLQSEAGSRREPEQFPLPLDAQEHPPPAAPPLPAPRRHSLWEDPAAD